MKTYVICVSKLVKNKRGKCHREIFIVRDNLKIKC